MQRLLIAFLLVAGCSREREFVSNRISITTTGSGPDIILIPGLASHRDVWAGVADSLDDHYTLHLVQLYGFAGLEARDNAQGPILGPVTEELASYIHEKELDRPAIIGHSMGGTLGMLLAARHPDLAGRVMVVDMIPYMGNVFGGPTSTQASIDSAADAMHAQLLTPPDSGPSMLEQMFATMTTNDSARAVLVANARASNRRTVADAFRELVVTDVRPELSRITVPLTVLFVVPENAPVPPAQFEQIFTANYSNAAGARLVRVDSAAHFIQIDRPGRFLAEVRRFMM